MDPRQNPYAPGAGTPPPELAGREDIIEKASIALDRIRAGRSARSLLIVGLRGVGKTVLLNRLNQDAEVKGITTLMLEAPERKSLPALLAPALRTAILKLDRLAAGGELAKKALRGLGSFIQAMKVKYADVEVGLDLGIEPGLADTGDLDADLTALLRAVGEAAKDRDTAVVLFIDELQYVEENELAALIAALHRCSQLQLPITLIGAGLPQLAGQMGNAKSYAERLFEFVPLDALSEEQARAALLEPAEKENASYEPAALESIFRKTRGYPYFLQEWGKHAWDCADSSPIRAEDVDSCATDRAIAELDRSFFRVRMDRLTPAERKYVRAMAELGAGPHRSGGISKVLGKSVNAVAPIRSSLIRKGMIYSPSHGDTAFTVPLFDEFLKRQMPNFDPLEGGA